MQATSMLYGMLDAALVSGQDLGAWRRTLEGHPLAAILPVKGLRSRKASASKQVVAACEQAAGWLGLARASAARAALAKGELVKAMAAGQSICLLGHTACEAMGGAHNLDLDRLCFIPLPGEASKLAVGWISSLPDMRDARDGQFDLIIATGLAQQYQGRRLRLVLENIRRLLSPNGKLLLASSLPGHLGLGWQTLCEGREIHCQDEKAIAAHAYATGYGISQCRDATDSIIWATLRPH